MTDDTIEELEQQVEKYERANKTSKRDSWEIPLQDAREELLEKKRAKVEELNEYASAAILAPEKRRPALKERDELRTEVEELEQVVDE